MRRSGISPPVKVDDVVDISIESVGEKGDGVGKVNRYIVFVPGTKAGDQCKIKITRTMDRFGFGEKVEG